MKDPLDELNGAACWDYRIASFDGWRLRLVGGTALSYPNSHLIEADFDGISYVSCPTNFCHARFRYASEEESQAIAHLVPIDSSNRVILIEAETTASRQQQRFCLVA